MHEAHELDGVAGTHPVNHSGVGLSVYKGLPEVFDMRTKNERPPNGVAAPKGFGHEYVSFHETVTQVDPDGRLDLIANILEPHVVGVVIEAKD